MQDAFNANQKVMSKQQTHHFFCLGIAVPSWYNKTSERASTLGEACKVEWGACSCAAATVAAVLACFLFLRFSSSCASAQQAPPSPQARGNHHCQLAHPPSPPCTCHHNLSRRPCLNHRGCLKHHPLSQSTPDKKWLETCARAQTTQQTTSKAIHTRTINVG